MTVDELFSIFRQNDIPNDAVLMSDSGWECCATDMDGVYYNKLKNMEIEDECKECKKIGLNVVLVHLR